MGQFTNLTVCTCGVQVCSSRVDSLGEDNLRCEAKLGQLEVCKSEIGRLAEVVQERFSQVTSSLMVLFILFR